MGHQPFLQHSAPYKWIHQAASHGTLPHSLLLWGNGDLMAMAQVAAAAFACQGQTPPCMVCGACEKVSKHIHPDVMVVEDTAHKFIAVDVLRQVRQSAFIAPNEGNRNVYIFPDGALLTEQGQNVLLKLVEEGPAHCAFVFCVENPDQILPTLRSRCVSLFVGQDHTEQPDPSPMAVALCQALLGKKEQLTTWAVKTEGQKPSRQDLESCLADARHLCIQALTCVQTHRAPPNDMVQALSQTCSLKQLSKTIELLQNYHRQCAFNISVGHTLGALAIELEELT